MFFFIKDKICQKNIIKLQKYIIARNIMEKSATLSKNNLTANLYTMKNILKTKRKS